MLKIQEKVEKKQAASICRSFTLESKQNAMGPCQFRCSVLWFQWKSYLCSGTVTTGPLQMPGILPLFWYRDNTGPLQMPGSWFWWSFTVSLFNAYLLVSQMPWFVRLCQSLDASVLGCSMHFDTACLNNASVLGWSPLLNTALTMPQRHFVKASTPRWLVSILP